MSEKQYLKNFNTGRVVDYTDILAARSDMVLTDVDGNRLASELTDSGNDYKDQRIAELSALLEKSAGGAMVMEMESAQQSLAAANDKLAEMTEEVDSLRAMVAALESAPPVVSDKLVAFEAFLVTLEGKEDVEKKKAILDWAKESLDLKLDARYSVSKMLESSRKAAK